MSDKDIITIEFIENNLNIIRSLYDSIRVIDPQRRKILLYKDGAFTEKGILCFNELDNKKMCNSCISMKALSSQKTLMRIEDIGNKVYMITSVPLQLNDKTVVVEMIKDVTDSLFYGSKVSDKNCTVNNIIEEMRAAAIKDSLTEIYNRRFIDERLPIDMKQCAKNNEPISIIMIDVDYFKEINDNFGHTTGDLVLKEFTECLRECIRRKKDWIARFGGEEFLVCIPGADEKEVLNVAERMYSNLKNKKFKHKDKEIEVTASFGVYTSRNGNISVNELLNYADEKLYKAKKYGRNRIEF